MRGWYADASVRRVLEGFPTILGVRLSVKEENRGGGLPLDRVR
jgi:hypothetical protein